MMLSILSCVCWHVIIVATSDSLSDNSNIYVISELTSIDILPLSRCQDFLLHQSRYFYALQIDVCIDLDGQNMCKVYGD